MSVKKCNDTRFAVSILLFQFSIIFLIWLLSRINQINFEYKLTLDSVFTNIVALTGFGVAWIIATDVTKSINKKVSSNRVEKDLLIEELKSTDIRLNELMNKRIFEKINHDRLGDWFLIFHSRISFVGEITPSEYKLTEAYTELHELAWNFQERTEESPVYSTEGDFSLDTETKEDLQNKYFRIKKRIYDNILVIND